MDSFKLFNLISIVALLIILTIAMAGWSSIEFENKAVIMKSSCYKFDRWSRRTAERERFIRCIAQEIGLKYDTIAEISVSNEWHNKFGFSLAIKYRKLGVPCYEPTDVWYLDRDSLNVLSFEAERSYCSIMIVN